MSNQDQQPPQVVAPLEMRKPPAAETAEHAVQRADRRIFFVIDGRLNRKHALSGKSHHSTQMMVPERFGFPLTDVCLSSQGELSR